MSSLLIKTSLGPITLLLRPDVAPTTVAHVKNLVGASLFNNVEFYRSDFVIQMGLYGTQKVNDFPDLPINESQRQPLLSNLRGAVAIAHHDVPDNGNSEMFINLGANTHLDEAYGGYCVFAQVDTSNGTSFETVDKIAEEIANNGRNVKVESVTLQ